ncbi:hypothetical protein [Telluribacter sp.]|jgi:uncharacterized membrane protein YjgN (DUF898 family)|uniref:hypothetical protein n=1 Tax=Telluribacter sp. TaxID=1978767 RepID=UPI002E113852|nr:hypothetical protein [Telluribacter sp.]
MKKEITRLDPGSVALMYGALLAFLGFIFVLIILVFGYLASMIRGGSSGDVTSMWLYGGGIAMIIFMPLLYGIIGVVIGYLFAFVYNLLAPRIGGIKVYIKDEQLSN